MNRDDIIRMAREAGLSHLTLKVPPAWSEFLIRFAALVAAHEREACAVIVFPCCKDCAKEIRARGEA